MNVCDENVTLKAGRTEKRYRVSAVIEATQTHRQVLDLFATACAGAMSDLSGMYVLRPGAPQVPVTLGKSVTPTDADLVAGAELTGSRHLSRKDQEQRTGRHLGRPRGHVATGGCACPTFRC